MKIFIDFDDTIFATRIFKRDLQKILWKRFDMSEDDFQKSRDVFSGTFGKSGEKYTFNRYVEVVAGIVQADDGRVFDVISGFFSGDLSVYIFDDVIKTLEKLKDHELILLSYGDKDFQMRKIRGSGIERYFKEVIIVDGDKYEAIKEYAGFNERVVLVDDKSVYFEAVKNANEKNISIHKIYEDEKCLSRFCDYHIRQFNELVNLI